MLWIRRQRVSERGGYMGCRPDGNDPQGGLARARWYSPKIHAGSAARALGPEILETLWAAATLTRGGANFKILLMIIMIDPANEKRYNPGHEKT